MKDLPVYHFFVVNRHRKITMRYKGFFVPRVGDTFTIGELALKVEDVVIESAQDAGEGVQHALYVHVKETKMPDASDCDDLEQNEFCDRMKHKEKHTMKGSPVARPGLQNL